MFILFNINNFYTCLECINIFRGAEIIFLVAGGGSLNIEKQ